MNADDCRDILAAALSALEVQDVRYLAQGWDSAVFVVNDAILFRFPKRAEVAAGLEREARLLPELGPTLTVPIPRFIYVVREPAAYPWTFVGYPMIPGTPADQLSLSNDQRVALALEVGQFLRELHAFPLDRAVALDVEPAHVAGGLQQFRTFVESVRAHVAPLLTNDDAQRLMRWFGEVEAEGICDFAPALVHGDLGVEHLLVDPATRSLAGVIDFGDTGIGGPAPDFTGLLDAFGEPAARAALDAYGRPDDAALLRRAGWYRDMSPLHEVIYGRFIHDE